MFFGCSPEGNAGADEDAARELFKQGQEAYAAGYPDSALVCFSEVGAMLASSDVAEQRNLAGEAYNTCGVIYFLNGNYPESVNSFLTAEQIGDEVVKARVYNNIASIFHYFNDNEKSMEYLERAAEGAQNTGEWDVLRSSTLNILNYCFEVNETGRAVAVMERFLEAPVPQDDWSEYITQTGFGMRAATKDSIAAAERYFKNAIEIASRLRDALRVLYEKTKHPSETATVADTPEVDCDNGVELSADDSAEQMSQKNVLDEEASRILTDKIIKVMVESKPYLKPSFSIKDLADLTESNTKYVSYALNNVLGKSFPLFVNTYRINEACTRLRNEAHQRAFTIESIANGVGFKSRTSFNTFFKKITGLTPKEYILIAKEDKKD